MESSALVSTVTNFATECKVMCKTYICTNLGKHGNNCPKYVSEDEETML